MAYRLSYPEPYYASSCGPCLLLAAAIGLLEDFSSVECVLSSRGGLCLPWMWMMCGVSMFPSVRLAAVVSPGRLLMRLGVRILRFARSCARGGFCDASGAEAGFLPDRCCAASL